LGGIKEMKKILIGLVIVLMLLLPVVSAFNIDSSNVNVQTNNNDIDLPDLIIEDIYEKYGWNPYVRDWVCLIKNIGNVACPPYKAYWINVNLTIERIRFGNVYKTENYNITNNIGMSPPLQPGESQYILIFSDEYISDYGRLYFSSIVNPYHTMEESNYDNNYYEEVVFNSIQSIEEKAIHNTLIYRILDMFPLLNLLLQRLRI
jgi:hypothetical protein